MITELAIIVIYLITILLIMVDCEFLVRNAEMYAFQEKHIRYILSYESGTSKPRTEK